VSGDESVDDSGSEDQVLANPKHQKTVQTAAASTEETSGSGVSPDDPSPPNGSRASASTAGTGVGGPDATSSPGASAGSGSPDASATAGGRAGSGSADVPAAGAPRPHTKGRLQVFLLRRLRMNLKESPRENTSLTILSMSMGPTFMVLLLSVFGEI